MYSFPSRPTHIVADLRLALSILYSLPTTLPPPTPPHLLSPAHAHEFLLHFQSRNARRKQLQFQSKIQNQEQPQSSIDIGVAGSTWLACIDVLSSFLETTNSNGSITQNAQVIHYEEALFVAQTLVHRLRRVKLSESVDIEFEQVNNTSNINLVKLPLSPEEVYEMYRQWILQYYHESSVLSQLLLNYKAVAVDLQQKQHQWNVIDLEERIKGEMSMIVLASILDTLTKTWYTYHDQVDDTRSRMQPLLKTLASALALIAARIRYTSSHHPEPAPQTQPCVTMILSSITMIQQQQQQQETTIESSHQKQKKEEAIQNLYCTCLTTLPEAILNGRSFSLDPRCYAALSNEIKTQGILQVLDSLQDLMTISNTSPTSSILILQMFESWAKYVPLPIKFASHTVPLVLQAFNKYKDTRYNHQSSPQQLLQSKLEYKAAMLYYIAIMEGGAWTVDQVILSASPNNKETLCKKRQSKKREQQFLQEKKTEDLLTAAHNEIRLRGDVACVMVQSTWDIVRELLHLDLSAAATDPNIILNNKEDDIPLGDGPVGAITACANACLPHILRTLSSPEGECNIHQDTFTNSIKLFTFISQEIRSICASPVRMIRSFASESLFTLYEVLINSKNKHTVSLLSPQLLVILRTTDLSEAIIVHFLHSSMNLASQCGYPVEYFDELGLNYDEDLEEERKNIRDLLRTVSNIPSSATNASSDDGVNSLSASLTAFTSSILLRLMQACAQPIEVAATSNTLFPETALHAFSALARPINTVASLYYKKCTTTDQSHCGNGQHLHTILVLAVQIASTAGRCLLLSFPLGSIKDLLPLSRLYDLAIASLSPMLSTIAKIPTMEPELIALMRISIEVAANSIIKIPELALPSSLLSSRYDIRGAMRTPAGEDHVGVLALMRLASESTALSHIFLKTNESVVLDLCGLYQELKKMEELRGPGVYHGIGVLPKSRRILLGSICHLELISGGTAQASTVLTDILENAIGSIANANNQLEQISADTLFCICENAFDIAAFAPEVANSLFAGSDDADIRHVCLSVLHEAGNFGFKAFHDASISCESLIQWNRVRAALYTLFTISGRPDLPAAATENMISWIRMECEAIAVQCAAGPTSSSKVFCEDVISDENIPPGIFFRVIDETLERAFSSHTPVSTMRNTLYVLCESSHVALSTITLDCSMPVQNGSFIDPRPVIMEVWFLCMNKLSVAVQGELHMSQEIEVNVVTDIKQLLVKTFAVAVKLLLYSSLEKTQDKRAKNPGMSLDGPQGLLMLDFFEAYFNLGSVMLQAAAKELVEVIPVDIGQDAETAGMAIIGAALLRIWQGGLPPWAIENISLVYPPLFKALNKNLDSFGHFFEISMTVRLQQNQRFGSVEGGSLLSGNFLAKVSDKTKHEFLSQAKELASLDSAASWKRFKVLIKKTCGGKKTTDFNQRPALTNWDKLDRI